MRAWKRRKRTDELTAEVAAVLMRAIEAASDALHREPEVPWASNAEAAREAAQHRADALGLLAERALAAGFGGNGECRDSVPAPVSGARAQRYQVVLHLDADTLSEDAEPAALPPGGRHARFS